MKNLAFVIIVQSMLLIYHQSTTWLDLSPFNGTKHYTRMERLTEIVINAILMSLPPLGYVLHNHGLMAFGVVYYFVLLAFEIIIWWIPYFTTPTGQWRVVYNRLLAIATSNTHAKNPLQDWLITYQRIHANTISILPNIPQRIVPNLEHIILHGWTVVTAITTATYYFQ